MKFRKVRTRYVVSVYKECAMTLRQKRILHDLLFPGLLLAGMTILFWLTDLDLQISALFFAPGEGWIAKDLPFWRFLYDYANVPAFMLAGGALAVLIGSWRVTCFKPYRRAALFLILALALGPGLIVNTIFKDHWGRPRPRNVQAFEGPDAFLPVWQKGTAKNGHSFASGHAAIAFFLFTPYFLLRGPSRRWAFAFLAAGSGWGFVVGLARIVQGGHFASDVLWAGGFVYLCNVLLYSALRLDRRGEGEDVLA